MLMIKLLLRLTVNISEKPKQVSKDRMWNRITDSIRMLVIVDLSFL